ncbi:hypothetical protein H477_5320 [[Clostridium] sordellii ATCC 9714]|nr:hypothetical protein H477_5320 [[Clostridium] sordellii ATCC 9714] [Paeniclostridium sordellii ATCC 9714]
MKKDSNLETTLILEGILFGIVGILFFINPIESYFSFTTVAGILLIIAGIFTIVRAFKTTEKSILYIQRDYKYFIWAYCLVCTYIYYRNINFILWYMGCNKRYLSIYNIN